MNIEGLIEPPREIRDRGESDAEFVRDQRFRLPQGELDADFHLGWRRAAFAQHAGGMGNGMFLEVDRHRYETGVRVPGGIRRRWRYDIENQGRGLSGAAQVLARLVLFLVQPDFRG